MPILPCGAADADNAIVAGSEGGPGDCSGGGAAIGKQTIRLCCERKQTISCVGDRGGASMK